MSTLRFALPILLLFLLAAEGYSAASPAGGHARALSAAQQLREYRAATEARHRATAGGILAKATAPEVSITLNSSAATASQIFYYENGEQGMNGWTTEDLAAAPAGALWHQSTLQASSPAHSWWAGREETGTYETGTRIAGAAMTPPIDLAAATGPVYLLFTEQYVTELGWDYCMVDVTTNDGNSWTPLRGAYGQAPSGNSEGWTISSLDLSSYAGATIKIRFHFDTGDSNFNAFPGWFVDDIVIFDQGGQVTGKTYFDANQNGVKDIGEQGIKEWKVTAAGPVTVTATSGYRGRYWLPLPLGEYTIAAGSDVDWTQTEPAGGGSHSVTLAAPDTLVDSTHFGLFRPTAFITGKVFHDLNRNLAFDSGDSLLINWKVTLSDTSGHEIDFDRTDSTGVYSLFVPSTGRFRVESAYRYGWLQSYPDDNVHVVDIDNLQTVVTDLDFSIYRTDTVQAIMGWNFNDRNRNGIQEADEPGVENFLIQLYRKNNTPNFHLYKQTKTDAAGYFRFATLAPDTYRVVQAGRDGWWHSTPETSSLVPLEPLGYRDSVMFGIYEIAPSSIRGTVFNDANGNGLMEEGEDGLVNWRINLSGKVSATTTTDSAGQYGFEELWPGMYTVSEVWKGGWVQTSPPSPGVYTSFIGPEVNRVSADFGNIDSIFAASFRTFTAESLALAVDKKGKHNPVPLKPTGMEFRLLFTNNTTMPVKALTVYYGVVPQLASLTSTRSGSFATAGKPNRITLSFDTPLPVDSSVIVGGWGMKVARQKVTRWRWMREDSLVTPFDTSVTWLLNALRLPMPNAVNVLQETGALLRVGLGGPHSVVSGKYRDIITSLVEGVDRIHLGVPRCLDLYSTGKSIKRQIKNLAPKKHNNVLFAEAITLQVNIRASFRGITPAGFGGLVYDEISQPALPLNGMTIIEIANTLDAYLSSYMDTAAAPACTMPSAWAGLSVDTLYDRIRKINAVFSGPIDTVSFGDNGLVLTGTKPLTEAPFLRYDAAAASRAALLLNGLEFGADEVPAQFHLAQNYPNPFNPVTAIQFTLPRAMTVTLKVYSMLGQEVATLLDREECTEGDQEVEFDGNGLASGVYFYRIAAEPLADEEGTIGNEHFTSVRKMMLVK